MTQIKVELKADITKVITLVDNEVITKEEGKGLLSQFTKEDLINYALEEDEEDEEYTEYTAADDLNDTATNPLEEVEVIPDEEEDDDKPTTKDEDFDDLLS